MSRTENPPLPQPAGAGSGGGGGRRRTGRGSDEPPRPGGGPSGAGRGRGRPPGERLDTTLGFLRSVLAELRRVDWPRVTEVRAATIVVVSCLLLVAGYVGLWDWLLALVFGTPTTGGY